MTKMNCQSMCRMYHQCLHFDDRHAITKAFLLCAIRSEFFRRGDNINNNNNKSFYSFLEKRKREVALRAF